ncbi:hypothetical protein J4Q44_G00082980 [Coregonus suidteri]|uniref:Uncharacterized protein n=1 Tax=Coregonus suidteri TaxID=861788 RepID=A0AAN8RBW9_9TELE
MVGGFGGLRKKLDLELCVRPPVLQASQIHMKNKGTSGHKVLQHHSIQQQSGQCFLGVGRHQVIDLLVLFILHSINANHSRRGAERVLKVKVRAGQIQEALLQKTFRGYAQVMRGYFPSILALAQSLLRSPDPCVVPFGGHVPTLIHCL